MAVYDIVVGLKLSNNHCSTLYFNREELEEGSSITDKYRKLHSAVHQALDTAEDIPNREDIISSLLVANEHLFKGGTETVTEEDLDIVKESFDIISYYGVESYILRRDDLGTTDMEPRAVRAYIMVTAPSDKHLRLTSALGISSTDITMGATTDLVMETFRSKIRINPSLDAIINLNTQIQNWELMQEVGAGYEYNSADLLELLENLGYKLKVFLTK